MQDDKITSLDKEVERKMEDISTGKNVFGIGKVVTVKEFILVIIGLENVMFYEKINIADKAIGYVVNILENSVYVALLKKEEDIFIGDLPY